MTEPVKRKRGRPRKNPLKAAAAELDAADSLCDLPICTAAPPANRVMQPEKKSFEERENEAGRTIREAFIKGLQLYATALPELTALVQHEIRADPRTEELKVVKAELDQVRREVHELKRTLKEAEHMNAEDKHLDKRILDEAADLKRKQQEVVGMVEPLNKRATNMEAQQKAIQARLNAMEARVSAVELK